MNDKLSIIQANTQPDISYKYTIQSNLMTYAHYDFTAIQKNVVYHIISAVQRHMTKIPPYTSNPDLFGNLEITLDIKQLTNTSNHTEVHKAIQGLMKRTLSYSYKLENGKFMDVTTTMLYTMKHERGSRKILLKISAESIPVLLYIGEGFTAYNQTIAIALPSVYAKRLYEICCRWRDRGYVRMKLSEFRKMLGIDTYKPDGKIEKQKFKQVKELKAEVLDKSMRLLQEQADYTFKYTLTKENSRAFNVIELWIESKDKKIEKEYTMYQNVLGFIRNIYDDKKRAYEVTELIYQNGQMKKAADRFKRLQQDVDKGKVKGHGLMAYLTTVLIKEFAIPENMVISEKTKRTKRAVEFAKELAKEGASKHDIQQAIAQLMKIQDKPTRSRTTKKIGDFL